MSASLNLDLDKVQAGLADTQFAGRLHYLASTASTNSLALAAAAEGASLGVWVADEQTAGRGRGGHAWHSAPGDGLYVSVLVRPRLEGADALKISLAAGLAACSAVREVAGTGLDIRWPNDLMVADPEGGSRKFGGILTETAMTGGDGALLYAVIGLGLNLNHRELPPELRATATSLRIASGRPVAREPLLISLLWQLEQEIAGLEAEAAGLPMPVTATLEARFEAASTWVRGLRVHVAEDEGYTGVSDGLDPRGLLRVRLEDGSVRLVRHGGVRRA